MRVFKWPLSSADYIELRGKKAYLKRRIKTLRERITRDSRELDLLTTLEREAQRVSEIRDGIPLGSNFSGCVSLGLPWDQTRSFQTYLNQHNKTTWCLKLGWRDRSNYTRDEVFGYNYVSDEEASKWGYHWVLTGLKPDHYEKELLVNLKGIS